MAAAPFDPVEAADRIGDLLASDAVRGGVTLAVLRRTLRWALARATDRIEAAQATGDRGWATRASDARLRAASLRHTAWSAVMDGQGDGDPVHRATELIVAALAFRRELTLPTCPPRLYDHAERLFGTTLLPGHGRFDVHRGRGRHVVVGALGALRAVEVIDSDGAVRSAPDIAGDLRACLAAAPSDDAVPVPVLALTGRPRAEAASMWPAMRRACPEAASLLREALFSVFFDPSAPADVDGAGRLAQAGPPSQRCYWHAMQLVVFRNGRAAVVGSFVAGVEGEGALALCERLGRGCPSPRHESSPTGSKDASGPVLDARAPPRPAPAALDWTACRELARPLGLASPVSRADAAIAQAGGLLVVPGFGRDAWADAGGSAEAAVVVSLRLALDRVIPDLDELEGMVSMGHVLSGIVMRIGTTTAQMRALIGAVRSKRDDLGPEVSGAIAAQRTRVKEAKRLQSAESALEMSLFGLAGLPRLVRGVVAFVLRWLQLLVVWRTAAAERKDLHQPVVGVDSSVPLPPGIAAIGRFGVLAPPRSIWVHHSIGATDVRFVVQLGPDHVARAKELREAIPQALARVHAAARAKAEPPASDPTRASPTRRLAYRRILFLGAALRGPAGHHG